MRIQTFAVVIFLSACTPIIQSSNNSGSNPKALKLMDLAYEPSIKTVRLFPAGSPLSPAVVRLGQADLMLDFDDLRSGRDNYFLRVVHCNFDWTPSSLQDLDFLQIYNEVPINNSEFSIDTHIPYVHYWVTLPPVKLPGNYVAVVYREGNKDDYILTRRFMVFDNQVTFTKDGKLVGPGGMANVNQQINFTINHQNLNIPNPAMDVHVNIRQNQRWDNMAADLKPSFIRDIQKELEYRFFDESKMFKGGNEFRFFDMRSLNYPGRNVASVNAKVRPFEMYLERDRSRSSEVYSQYPEINGNFIIDNYDVRDPSYSNYAYVNFSLASHQINGEVFVSGAFNYWNNDRSNRMQYDTAQNIYKSRMLLKQGYYDYQYTVRSSTLPPHYFEGSYFQTENFYEVFVYYRPFQPKADLLVGYIRFEENPRRN